jgi:hypothetical protein
MFAEAQRLPLPSPKPNGHAVEAANPKPLPPELTRWDDLHDVGLGRCDDPALSGPPDRSRHRTGRTNLTVEAEEVLPPTPTAPAGIGEQSLLPLDRAAAGGIDAQNLAVALDLAKAGIPIFPARLDQNGETKKWEKRPAIKGWKTAATTDLECIRGWWRDLPFKLGLPVHRLVPGIWCGHPALDWIVIDADRHGGPDGVSAFDALAAMPGNGLPVGPRTMTAGNGIHFVFRQRSGTKFGNSDGELPGGIDVRGVGGWIVGPGAIRPDDRMWRPSDGAPCLVDAFKDRSIPELPFWLTRIISESDKLKEPRKPKSEAKEGKQAAGATPQTSDRKATKREKRYAQAALDNIVKDLAAMPPDSGRNEFVYRKAVAVGTMVARDWIDRRTVLGACLGNS